MSNYFTQIMSLPNEILRLAILGDQVATEKVKAWAENVGVDYYEYIQYGAIPKIYGMPSTPSAPSTEIDLTKPYTSYTPQQAIIEGHNRWTKSIADLISNAEADGSYRPETQPVATLLDKYKWALILGGIGLVLVLKKI